LIERCSEFKNRNEALNRQVEELLSQDAISRDKLKKARRSLQTEKEESTRLRLAFDRQRKAKDGEVTEKKEMQAKLDAKDREVSYFRPLSLSLTL
jgi:hypothetical protein